MELTRTLALIGSDRLSYLQETGSTNDDLRALVDAPEFTTIVTTSQVGGRGRLGRVWVAPPGQSVAVSVLLRPMASGRSVDPAGLGWIPLIAGLAMTRAIAALGPRDGAMLKWPNDVLIDGRKVSGILTELGADGSIVIGAGVNLAIPVHGLPTATATSLGLVGVEPTGAELVDLVVSGWLTEVMGLYSRFVAADGDADSSGIRHDVEEACGTLGREVRVALPNGDTLTGRAVRLDAAGRIEILRSTDGGVQAVAAGDVEHLRYE